MSKRVSIYRILGEAFRYYYASKIYPFVETIAKIEQLHRRDKIRILKRTCHKMKCYKEMCGDCPNCPIGKEITRLKKGGMMTTEQMVIKNSTKNKYLADLELSKQLYDLGIRKNEYPVFGYDNPIHGWSTDELLEMLPVEIGYLQLKICKKLNGGYWVYYKDNDNDNGQASFIEDIKFSNALAKMLIKLIEGGIIKVEDLNK